MASDPSPPFESERLRRVIKDAERAREQVRQLLTPQTLAMLRAARQVFQGIDLERLRAEAEAARAAYARFRELYPSDAWEALRGQMQQFLQSADSFAEMVAYADEAWRVREQAADLFRQLPDLLVLRQQTEQARAALDQLHERAEAGEEVLGAAGFGFADHLLGVVFLASLADITPGIQAQVVTKKMAAFTQSRAFEAELREVVERSSLLPRRWLIVRRALEAHAGRDYVVSVPLLLAQVEGCVNDLLVLKELAVVRKGKVYVRGPDGKIKSTAKGKPIELKGLGTKIDHHGLQDDELLVKASDLLLNRLIPDRNTILHGSNVRYARAKLSTQAVLFLRILITVVVAAEHGDSDN